MMCSDLFKAGTAVKEVNFYNYERLHKDGKHLIRSWFWRSRDVMKRQGEPIFEPFIFTWFAFNGWGMCVTGADDDAVMLKSLAYNEQINQQFGQLLETQDSLFSENARRFIVMLPIFDVKKLDESGILRFDNQNRTERVNFYLERGATVYEPRCWKQHYDSGESVPLDWPHTLKAIYKVRCNLFHGRKSAHSEMDKQIVLAASLTLSHFINEARYI